MNQATLFPFYVIYLLFAHWVGDFVGQTHEMATKKSYSGYHLLAHVLAYSGIIAVFLACLMLFQYTVFMPNNTWQYAPITHTTVRILLFIIINALLHMLTDYFTSKRTAQLWQQQRWHDFFVVIGFDQFIHAATLIFTFYWVFFHLYLY